jgi:cytochrome b561
MNGAQFAWSSRVLHWLMATLLLAMLFVGVHMVSSLAHYERLLSIHRPLGIALLVLALVRALNRRLKPPPDFPVDMPSGERRYVVWSERLLYALMFAQPLVGWGMSSAAGNAVPLFGGMVLPPLAPQSSGVFTALRAAHALLGYAFFAAILLHLAGVLFHALVLRDGLLMRMAPWRARARGDER